MYSGVVQPTPIPTLAAHIPQQSLVPVRPKVPNLAAGTRYQPAGVDLRLPGEDVYAPRLRNAAAHQRRLAREKREALKGLRGFAQADANAFAVAVAAAEAGAAAVSAQQAAFTAAGAPVDETQASASASRSTPSLPVTIAVTMSPGASRRRVRTSVAPSTSGAWCSARPW